MSSCNLLNARKDDMVYFSAYIIFKFVGSDYYA